MTGIEKLRDATRAFGMCEEGWCEKFTAVQLLRLRAVWRACEWDIPPDQWSEEQIREALTYGTLPTFEDEP